MADEYYSHPSVPLNSDYFLYDRYVPPAGVPNDNPYYTCYIVCPDKGFTITANLPQEYSLDFGASYESSFSQSISENAFSSARKAASALGLQFATKAMTAKVWQGSNDVTFTLPLIFQLETDYFKDILEPLSQLYQLVLPTQSSHYGLLEAPGPSIDLEKLKEYMTGPSSPSSSSDKMTTADSGPSTGSGDDGILNGADPTAFILNCIKNNCMLMIGDYQFFDSVIVTNISQTVHVLPYYKTGTMSRIEVAVTFSTFMVPTASDIPSLLIGSDQPSGLSGSPGSAVSDNTSLNGGDASAELLDAGTHGDTLTDEEYEDYLNNSGIF